MARKNASQKAKSQLTKAERSTAAKKAWRTRRKKYGKDGRKG